jgi:hypothetical protein
VSCPRDSLKKSGPRPRPEDAAPDPSCRMGTPSAGYLSEMGALAAACAYVRLDPPVVGTPPRVPIRRMGDAALDLDLFEQPGGKRVLQHPAGAPREQMRGCGRARALGSTHPGEQ